VTSAEAVHTLAEGDEFLGPGSEVGGGARGVVRALPSAPGQRDEREGVVPAWKTPEGADTDSAGNEPEQTPERPQG
jgi:hypothetical protein